MGQRAFDTLTRRASLLTLGAAGAAVLTSPIAASAKKKKKGDVNKRCKKQVGECTASLVEFCEGNPDCLDCCQTLATCDITGFANCLAAVLGP